MEFDESVVRCFYEKQEQLFGKKLLGSLAEAEDFLEECMAVVVESPREVWDYFEEAGIDTEAADEEGILEAQEVFAVGDGKYLIVEG
jgi:hypothetical protein